MPGSLASVRWGGSLPLPLLAFFLFIDLSLAAPLADGAPRPPAPAQGSLHECWRLKLPSAPRHLPGIACGDWSGDGLDFAAPVDIGLPEGDAVAVGYNGDGGIHLLNPNGTLRWKATGPWNAQSVAAARLAKAAPCSIVCTHAEGTILVYDATGKRVAEFGKGYGVGA